jgi:ATP-dependent DNA helicase RecQ
MADKAVVWAKRYLRELARYPVNGELSIGDILHRYYKYNSSKLVPTYTKHNAEEAAQIDSKLMIDLEKTIQRVSLGDFKDRYRQMSRSKEFKAKARELSAILEKSENILIRGKKRGRTYRHKNARPMLTDRAIASLVPKLFDAIEIEVRWMQIHPLVVSMVMEFHRSCEDNPDLWIKQLSNPLIFVVDQNELQVSLIDGRRRLQFSFQTEGLTHDDITPYKNEFHTRIEDWVPNVYTREWFSKSSANIQRLLSQGGLVCEGSKRGYWIYRDNLSDAQLESRRIEDAENVVTHSREGLWTIIAKTEDMFTKFNTEFKRFSDVDRATAVVLEKQLKAQLERLEKISREPDLEIGLMRHEQMKTELFDKVSERLGRIDRLRDWRLKKANGAPAYQVFSDKTMKALEREMPRTEGELLLVHGIGPGKVKRFGPELIEFLKELSESTTAAAT